MVGMHALRGTPGLRSPPPPALFGLDGTFQITTGRFHTRHACNPKLYLRSAVSEVASRSGCLTCFVKVPHNGSWSNLRRPRPKSPPSKFLLDIARMLYTYHIGDATVHVLLGAWVRVNTMAASDGLLHFRAAGAFTKSRVLVLRGLKVLVLRLPCAS